MDFLLKEIEITQASIARYDQNGMMIKNWCITTWGATTAYGFQYPGFDIIAIAPYIVLCFFMVEWVYRTYQYRFIKHAATLETVAHSEKWQDYRYSICSIASTKLKGERLVVLKQPHFVGLYLMLLIGSGIAIAIKF